MAMTFVMVRRPRGPFLRVVALSGLLALLQLSTSFCMLTVYDRVLPSGSVMTLAGLMALTVSLHAAFAGLDAIRARIVCRAGLRIVAHLDGGLPAALGARRGNREFSLLNDAERVRGFLTGAGPCVAFDLLWLPAFVAAAFFLHAVLGAFAIGGALVLAVATAWGERHVRAAGRRLHEARHRRHVLAWDLYAGPAGSERRGQGGARSWDTLSRCYDETTLRTAVRTHTAQAFGKGLRLALQSAGLGLGALLALEGLLSAGGLIASSLIFARTFACLDGVLVHWSRFVVARESYQRLVRAAGEEPRCGGSDGRACLSATARAAGRGSGALSDLELFDVAERRAQGV
jgi:ABC-type protease/lipase transport system fused ATPase/permease subunit